MRLRSRFGFTLIELVVTLAVLTIFAVVAVPSFNSLIDKSRLRGATDDIVNLLNTARVSAVKLQREVNVSVEAGTTWCAGAAIAPEPTIGDRVGTATACDCASGTVSCLVNSQPLLVSSTAYKAGSNTVKVTSGGGNQLLQGSGGITFNAKFGALDLASTQPTALTLTSPSGKYSTQITVSTLGQPYVCVPAGALFVSGYQSC